MQLHSWVFLKKSLYILCYISSVYQLLEFKQRINEVHPSTKFDFNFSNKEINFLDTVVYETATHKLETKLYTKDINRRAYLRCKSEHPKFLKCTLHLRKPYPCDVYVQLQNNFNETVMISSKS